jgi:opacity protein-like surface antigen
VYNRLYEDNKTYSNLTNKENFMINMNKITLGAGVLYTLSFLISTHAEEGKTYVAGNFGVGISAKKFDYDPKHNDIDPTKLKNSMNFGVALGYKVADHVRAELAINRFQNFKYQATDKQDTDMTYSQKISSTSAFINGYYDIKEMNGFMPYITAGVGFSKNKAGDFSVNSPSNEPTVFNGKAQTEFGWNAGVGIAYNLNERITLDLLNYKYYDLGKVSTDKDDEGDVYGGKLKVHSINTGIRIKF